MASASDRSRFSETLPDRPSLEMQQKRAKALLRAAWASDADALARIRTLHPKPPAPDALKLADAQLVVARGYGFQSWAALARKIASLTHTPVEQFLAALELGDVDEVRRLLANHADVRAAINAPISHFNTRPIARAVTNLPMLDLLLEYGADLNVKSAWWAGGFGLLEYNCTPDEAAPLIARGAVVDIFAAAHLGMFERVRELVEADPSLVHARGGDGKTPLHCARTAAIARYLLDAGAEIDARDVDHESTPAQYLVRDAPDAVRVLVDRGAWFDIFIAIGLHDRALVERALQTDPEALDHRTWHGKYRVAHNGSRPATREEIGDRRGDIYRWVFGHNVSAIDAAVMIGDEELHALLLEHASPAQQLLAACASADRARVDAIVARHPGLVARLTSAEQGLIGSRAHANDTEAVRLMIAIGFDPLAATVDRWEPIRWAVFHGNAALTRLLLAHRPPLNTPDRSHGGTLLANCLHGSVHGWHRTTGDFAATVQLLLDAGERLDPSWVPIGRDDVDGVLRAWLRL